MVVRLFTPSFGDPLRIGGGHLGLDVLGVARQQLQRVGHHPHDGLEALHRPLGAAGQVQHQGLAHDAGPPPGDDRHRADLPPDRPHRLRQARGVTGEDSPRGLRRDVTGAETGAAGGHHEIGRGRL